MSVPIACTLSSDEVGDRIEEWRRFFATSVDTADVAAEHSLRLQLKDDPAVLVAAVDLARREVTCCAFFDFSIAIESSRSWLVIEVPPAAREILDGLAALLPGGHPNDHRLPTDS
jgi:hypothetical protein